MTAAKSGFVSEGIIEFWLDRLEEGCGEAVFGSAVAAIAKMPVNAQIPYVLDNRRIELDNGWIITLGRGLDFYQRPDDWLEIGASELNLRQCVETTINFRKA